MTDFQYYPTPLWLAQKAWSLFKNRNFVRVLEPSAGSGDLLKARPGFGSYHDREVKVDCCEIDASKHPFLREISGVSIVGLDFTKFGGGAIYSHVIMNPPFAYDVQHVLRAWDGLYDGEIVAIIKAESLRNPFSKERKHLARLVENHGSVDFIKDAFLGEDVVRETSVEIALVYLRKTTNVGFDITSKVLEGLKKENEEATFGHLDVEVEEMRQLALPTSFVENQVLVFNAAVKAMRASLEAEAQACQAADLIGRNVDEIFGEDGDKCVRGLAVQYSEWVKYELRSRYLGLKERAWANLISSSNVESKLSSAALKRMRSAFGEIKELEFTTENINGFLRGLVEAQPEIVMQMACDVFDVITRYHSDNVVFYKGWASNDRHRKCGMRLKKTRFVLPGNLSYAGASHLSYEATQRLNDFDKVLSLLDGKQGPEVSIASLFGREGWARLAAGERLSATYMDIRFYPKSGTIHFFPRSQELMDKLNVMVGKHRCWLPPQGDDVSDDFMTQFKEADRFDKEMRQTLAAKSAGQLRSNDPLWCVLHEGKDDCIWAHEEVYQAMTDVHASHGIHVDFHLQQKKQAALRAEQLRLAA